MGKIVTLSKMSEEERQQFYKENGRKAVQVSIKKYSRRQRQQWARLGGRPRTTTLKIIKALRSGPKSRLEISQKTKLPIEDVSRRLNRLAARGEVENVERGQWKLVEGIANDGAKPKAANQNRQQKSRRQVSHTAIAS